MKNICKGVRIVLGSVGVDVSQLYLSIRGIPQFFVNLATYLHQSRGITREGRTRMRIRFAPMLADRYRRSGTAKGHYFHQDLWAARKIFARRPHFHVDVGSRIDGFIAHILVFMDIEVFDLRNVDARVRGLRWRNADVTDVEHVPANYCSSLSCLHALEHFGLGRYGDKIDARGHIRGIDSLSKMLKPHGVLYLSVPIGKEKVYFNAHRVFDPATIQELTRQRGLQLLSFSYVDDDSNFHGDVPIADAENVYYGCGCFEFKKVASSATSPSRTG